MFASTACAPQIILKSWALNQTEKSLQKWDIWWCGRLLLLLCLGEYKLPLTFCFFLSSSSSSSSSYGISLLDGCCCCYGRCCCCWWFVWALVCLFFFACCVWVAWDGCELRYFVVSIRRCCFHFSALKFWGEEKNRFDVFVYRSNWLKHVCNHYKCWGHCNLTLSHHVWFVCCQTENFTLHENSRTKWSILAMSLDIRYGRLKWLQLICWVIGMLSWRDNLIFIRCWMFWI